MNIIVTNFIFPRLHYLFYSTFALIAGITCQFLCQQIAVSMIVAVLATAGAYACRLRLAYGDTLCLVLPISFLAGSLLCLYQQQKFDAFYGLTTHKVATIRGSVSFVEKIYNQRFKAVMHIDVSTIATPEEIIHCNQTIALYVRDIPNLLVGDIVEIDNITFKKTSRGSFATYLLKEKIAATLFIETLSYTLIKRPAFSAKRTISLFKNKVLYQLKKKINSETFQLFSSIFLGNRTAVKKQMDTTKEPFKIWGTSHYLARSGLHLVIFVIIWHFILGLLPLSYLLKQLFLLLLIFTYALLSWSSVSFERALLMVIIYKLCTISGSACHYVHLIIFVTALVLCNNPYQLFFLDFQLSFGLTFALAWFNYIQARKKLAYS